MENMVNLEQSHEFMQSVMRKLEGYRPDQAKWTPDRHPDLMEYMISKCQRTKRWTMNYKDRVNVQINLVDMVL